MRERAGAATRSQSELMQYVNRMAFSCAIRRMPGRLFMQLALCSQQRFLWREQAFAECGVAICQTR
jgi:hypothetical protein